MTSPLKNRVIDDVASVPAVAVDQPNYSIYMPNN